MSRGVATKPVRLLITEAQVARALGVPLSVVRRMVGNEIHPYAVVDAGRGCMNLYLPHQLAPAAHIVSLLKSKNTQSIPS
jgi:hypothetical protein